MEPDQAIQIDRHADSYSLKLHISQIEGLCYSPASIQLNGYLSLDGIDDVNGWAVVRTDPTKVEGLDSILSSKRAKIDSRGIELLVPKDVVIKRPFNVQVIAYPCDAPTVSKVGAGEVRIVSVAADLPPFETEEQRSGA
jgi:hypothetical protein